MKLLDEIRRQPLHIRHLFMWTMVVITFSLVGFAWFSETQNDFVALLGGKEQEQIQEEAPSPFAVIKNLPANMLRFFQKDNDEPAPAMTSTIPPQRLP
ncbi:MAG: hypothetical protein AAB420_04370 [Patescibacteria group bacterium]